MIASSKRHIRLVDGARAALRDFAIDGPCYIGTSWGKDSVVLAHLAATVLLGAPLVWIRIEPLSNPDCPSVRDAFLSTHPGANYHEIVVDAERDAAGDWLSTGRLESGFRVAVERFGERHVSGIRAEESTKRRLRMASYGHATERACAPIGWWTGDDVFAYLYAHGLPVHPAYAMSFGGMLDRNRIRVASIGGERGTGHGRREWEERYYPDESARSARGHE